MSSSSSSSSNGVSYSRDQEEVHKLMLALSRLGFHHSGSVNHLEYANRMRLYMAIERMKHNED